MKKMGKLCWKLLLGIVVYVRIICASMESNGEESRSSCVTSGSLDGLQNADEKQSQIFCPAQCFALWREDPNNGSVIVMGQGK